MGGIKKHDKILDHYTAECPVCRGVMMPERIELLEAALEAVKQDRSYWYERWRQETSKGV
jgi:hypothetical protein